MGNEVLPFDGDRLPEVDYMSSDARLFRSDVSRSFFSPRATPYGYMPQPLIIPVAISFFVTYQIVFVDRGRAYLQPGHPRFFVIPETNQFRMSVPFHGSRWKMKSMSIGVTRNCQPLGTRFEIGYKTASRTTELERLNEIWKWQFRSKNDLFWD